MSLSSSTHGRAVELNGDLQKGTRGRAPRTIGAKAGDREDMLELYLASRDLKNAPPSWKGRAVNWLKPPEKYLLKEFQSRVEAGTKAPWSNFSRPQDQ